MNKTCSECKNLKKISDYYNKNIAKDGKETICKKCRISKYAEKRKEYHKTYVRKKNSEMKKCYDTIKCKKCEEVKTCSDYYYENGYYRKTCKLCMIKYKTAYAKDNRNKINMNRRKKFQTNPQLKIIRAFGSRIYHILKNKTKSSQSIETYLDCTFQQFLDWMQFQFQDGMTFENYGSEWHVDHVNPCSSFDLTDVDQLKICMKWTNLRPCWKIENLKKSNKICNSIIEEHEKNVIKFNDKSTGLIE